MRDDKISPKRLLWRSSGFVAVGSKIKSNQTQKLDSQFPAATQKDTGIPNGYHQPIITRGRGWGHWKWFKMNPHTPEDIHHDISTSLHYSLVLTGWTNSRRKLNMVSLYLTELFSGVFFCFARCHHLSISRTSTSAPSRWSGFDLSPVCIHVLLVGPRSVFH